MAMGWNIDRKDWEQGYGLFRQDLTPAGSCHPSHLVSHHSGNVNLYLKFDTPIPAVLNLIVYAEFQTQKLIVTDAQCTISLKVVEKQNSAYHL